MPDIGRDENRHLFEFLIFGMPLIERRRTDVQLSANVGRCKNRFNPFDRIHELAVGEF